MEILRKNKGLNLFYELYTEKAGFAEEMLQNNHFRYLPHVRLQWTDMRCSLLYKADGMQSFATRFAREEVDWLRIRELLRDLTGCIEEVQEYLLAPEGIVLSTAYILYDERTGNYRFLYQPEPEMSFAESMKQLLEEIMPRFAHEKREEVVLFYELYSKFLDDRFTPAMLIRMVEQWDAQRAPGGGEDGRVQPYGGERQDGGMPQGRYEDFSVEDESGPGRPGNRSVNPSAPSAPLDDGMKPSGKPWGIYAMIIGAVLAAVLLYLWKGGESLKFSALLGVAVVIVIYGSSSGRKKKEETARENRNRDSFSGNTNSGRNQEPDHFPAVGDPGRSREMSEYLPAVVRGGWRRREGDEDPSIMTGGGGWSQRRDNNPSGVNGSAGWNHGRDNNPSSMTGSGGWNHGRDGDPSNLIGDGRGKREAEISPPTAAGYPRVNRVTRLVPSVGSGQQTIVVSEGVFRIGRSEVANEYCISAPGISRNHARLECSGGVVNLTDMHSTNGTFVNQERIEEEQTRELHYGDVVSFAGEEYYCV